MKDACAEQGPHISKRGEFQSGVPATTRKAPRGSGREPANSPASRPRHSLPSAACGLRDFGVEDRSSGAPGSLPWGVVKGCRAPPRSFLLKQVHISSNHPREGSAAGLAATRGEPPNGGPPAKPEGHLHGDAPQPPLGGPCLSTQPARAGEERSVGRPPVAGRRCRTEQHDFCFSNGTSTSCGNSEKHDVTTGSARPRWPEARMLSNLPHGLPVRLTSVPHPLCCPRR